MIFKGWQKTSLIEYPGKISTVLFTGGCNFRCPFCYNPDLVPAKSDLPDIGQEMVLDYLQENKRLYQAVVVTGGEPTLNPSLPEFLRLVRDFELLTGLETNGSNPEMLQELLRDALVDFIGMDVKAPLDRASYERATGIRDDSLIPKVERSLALLGASSVDFELRTTVVPGLHSEQDITLLIKQLDKAERHVLQPFVPGRTLDSNLRDCKPFPQDVLASLQGLTRPDRFARAVGGRT